MANKALGEALAGEATLMRKLGLQLAELKDMGLAELRGKHQELYGEEAKSKNLDYLRKRLAFRLQERVEGGLSVEARTRLEELTPSELPIKAGRRPVKEPPKAPRDPRLPAPGSVLCREHKGFAHEVEVLAEGFRYRGRSYQSLSAIAREISGTAWNGFAFFGLLKGDRHEG